MKPFSKAAITILIFVLCQFVISFPIPQKTTKVLIIQPIDDVAVVLTGANEVNDESSGVYMTTEELPDVGVFENQSPRKSTKVLTIQLTNDVTVVLTSHNEINGAPSDVTTVELPDVRMSEDQFSEVTFSEIQFPEVKFPEIHFTIFEKIREFFETIVKFITEIQLPEIKFPEVEFPEVKFPEIQFPSLEPIFEKFVNSLEQYPWIFLGLLRLVGFSAVGIVKGSMVAIGQSIGVLGTCGATIFHVLGCGTVGIVKGSLVAICQSIATIGAGGLSLLPVVVMA
ncbi:4976_t:CDS:2, partial [Dentiscutata heterogama]